MFRGFSRIYFWEKETKLKHCVQVTVWIGVVLLLLLLLQICVFLLLLCAPKILPAAGLLLLQLRTKVTKTLSLRQFTGVVHECLQQALYLWER